MVKRILPRKTNTKIGAEFEKAAERFLLAHPSASLLARNYRLRFGELDLILEEGTETGALELVFVEVRSRRGGSWLKGIECVDPRKRARLERSAEKFLASYRGRAQGVRFDILAWNGVAWERFKNAW